MITLEMVRNEINSILEKNKLLKEQLDSNDYFKEEIAFARTDDLTGLPNTNYLKRIFLLLNLYIIEGMLSKANAYTIGFCDINGLKMINDLNGHHIGDIGMVEIVNIIKQHLRTNRKYLEDDKLFLIEGTQEDTAIRYGGDEFLLILPNCNKYEADTNVGERIKKSIRDNSDKTQQLSLAIGFVCTDEDWIHLPPDLEEENIIKFFQQLVIEAGNRMYEDKIKMGQEGQYDSATACIIRLFDVLGLDLKDRDHIETVIKLINEQHNNSLDISVKTKR